MKVLFFFKSGDLLLLKSGEFKFANYTTSLAMLLQAIVCRLPYSVLCLLATLQVWQVRTSRTPAFTHSNVTVTAKYTPKAKPRSFYVVKQENGNLFLKFYLCMINLKRK